MSGYCSVKSYRQCMWHHTLPFRTHARTTHTVRYCQCCREPVIPFLVVIITWPCVMFVLWLRAIGKSSALWNICKLSCSCRTDTARMHGMSHHVSCTLSFSAVCRPPKTIHTNTTTSAKRYKSFFLPLQLH